MASRIVAIMIKFNCPHCQQSLRVPVSRADTEATCPGCHSQIRVPPSGASEEAEVVAAPPVVAEQTPSSPAVQDEPGAVMYTGDLGDPAEQASLSSQEVADGRESQGTEHSGLDTLALELPEAEPAEFMDQIQQRTDDADASEQDLEGGATQGQDEFLKDRRQKSEVSSQVFDDLADRVMEDTTADAKLVTHRRAHRQLGVSRGSLYLFAVLIFFVAFASFWLGTMMNPAPEQTLETGIAGVDDYVNFEGRVTFRTANDPESIDEKALVILLPEDSLPSEKFTEDGIAAGVDVDESLASIQELRRLGGDITLTDEAGEFALQVASGHRYYLLVVSAMKTATEQPGDNDLEELGRYFESPARLLEGKFYRWSLEVVNTHRDIRVYHR